MTLTACSIAPLKCSCIGMHCPVHTTHIIVLKTGHLSDSAICKGFARRVPEQTLGGIPLRLRHAGYEDKPSCPNHAHVVQLDYSLLSGAYIDVILPLISSCSLRSILH